MPVSWKKRLYNRTPQLVMLAGYLLGTGILMAAASTWFIETQVFSQGVATIRPAVDEVRRDVDVVVTRRFQRIGAGVQKGEPLLEWIEDPEIVASRRLVHDLEDPLRLLDKASGPRARERAAELRRIRQDFAGSAAVPQKLAASGNGWLVRQEGERADDAPAAAEEILAAGAPLARIAHLREIAAEVVVSGDRLPILAAGDTSALLFADWDAENIPAEVRAITSTVVLQIPLSKFADRERAHMKENATLALRLFEREITARITLGRDTASFSLELQDLPSFLARQIRSNHSLAFSLPGLGDKRLEVKPGSIQSKISLKLNERHLRPALREALEKRLAAGDSSLGTSNCRVQVETRSLFYRLFSS